MEEVVAAEAIVDVEEEESDVDVGARGLSHSSARPDRTCRDECWAISSAAMSDTEDAPEIDRDRCAAGGATRGPSLPPSPPPLPPLPPLLQPPLPLLLGGGLIAASAAREDRILETVA